MKKVSIISLVLLASIVLGNQVNAQTTKQKTKSSAKSVNDHITVQRESVANSNSGKTSQSHGTVTSTSEKSLPPRPTPESGKKSSSSGGAKTSGNAN